MSVLFLFLCSLDNNLLNAASIYKKVLALIPCKGWYTIKKKQPIYLSIYLSILKFCILTGTKSFCVDLSGSLDSLSFILLLNIFKFDKQIRKCKQQKNHRFFFF